MELDPPQNYNEIVTPPRGKRKHIDLPSEPLAFSGSYDLVPRTLIAHDPLTGSGHSDKRIRLDQPFGQNEPRRDHGSTHVSVTSLPPEILQHMFSFVDPISLGRLLRVCRIFNILLDPTKELPSPTTGSIYPKLRNQNDIWESSRKSFLRGFVRPMKSMTELEMWSLLRAHRCQFCQRKRKKIPSFMAATPWNGGPAQDDVRVIWPFRVRACGKCLEMRLQKDTDLLMSRSSPLMAGLAFACFTPSLHYVTSVTLRDQQPPPDLRLTKYFFRPQVEELEDKLVEVQALGSAVVAEWFKGLETTGRNLQDDAARFESWEKSLIAHIVVEPSPARLSQLPKSPTVSVPSAPSLASSSSAYFSHQAGMTSPHRPASAQSSRYSSITTATSLALIPALEMPLQPVTPAPGVSPQSETQARAGKQDSSSSRKSHRSHTRSTNVLQLVERVKAERRADIERRCQELTPPIRPSTLTFMDAFKAAIQIATPLNDPAWDLLKHRLLDQRAEAQQKENEHIIELQAQTLEAEDRKAYEEMRHLDQQKKDKIWEQIQRPPREKLRAYADEYISSIWDGGIAVTPATCSKFAADVLLKAKKRFTDGITEEDKLLASSSMRIPHGSSIHDVRRLRLEDLKWLFEESVRPHTERFGKDIFLCSVCEGSVKRFSFEAVIQHYAAKHTSALSQGARMVYWKADWPDDPPFHPFPDTVWNCPPEDGRPSMAPPHYGSSSFALPLPPNFTPSPMHSSMGGSDWQLANQQGPRNFYEQHCEELVDAAATTWHDTDQIRGLPNNVRLYVIIHRCVLRFSQKSTNQPPSSLFMDCVKNKPALRPLHDLRGLRCRACAVFGPPSHGHQLGEYGLTGLLDHFLQFHVQLDHRGPPSMSGPTVPAGGNRVRLDWKFDMVELPHEHFIRNLVHAPGITDHKLDVIASVFPNLLTPPVPHIRSSDHRASYVPRRTALVHAPNALIADHEQQRPPHVHALSGQQGYPDSRNSVYQLSQFNSTSSIADPGLAREYDRQMHRIDMSRGLIPMDNRDRSYSVGSYATSDRYGSIPPALAERTLSPTRTENSDRPVRPPGLPRYPSNMERGLPFRPIVADQDNPETGTASGDRVRDQETAQRPIMGQALREDGGVVASQNAAQKFLEAFDPFAENNVDVVSSSGRVSHTDNPRSDAVQGGRMSNDASPSRNRPNGVLSHIANPDDRHATPTSTIRSRHRSPATTPPVNYDRYDNQMQGRPMTEDDRSTILSRSPAPSAWSRAETMTGYSDTQTRRYEEQGGPQASHYRHASRFSNYASPYDGHALSPEMHSRYEARPAVRYVEVFPADGRRAREGATYPYDERHVYSNLEPRDIRYVESVHYPAQMAPRDGAMGYAGYAGYDAASRQAIASEAGQRYAYYEPASDQPEHDFRAGEARNTRYSNDR